jgi:rhodanese-related sulfurtransferase
LTVPQVTPLEFRARVEAGNAVTLLDVREAWELAIARVEGAVHMPMGEVPERIGELAPEHEIVVMCHAGGRSAQVVRFLQQRGFENAFNLAGGILAWSEQVDPSIPTY